MTAFCYDLSQELISFDFYGWLVRVRALGATEIVFEEPNDENVTELEALYRGLLSGVRPTVLRQSA